MSATILPFRRPQKPPRGGAPTRAAALTLISRPGVVTLEAADLELAFTPDQARDFAATLLESAADADGAT